MELSDKISGKMKTLIFVGTILGFSTGGLWGLQLFEFLFNVSWMDFIVGIAIIVGGGMILDYEVDRTLEHARVGASASLPSPLQAPTVLAICPQCKSRIPCKSKFCLECGANLRPKKNV